MTTDPKLYNKSIIVLVSFVRSGPMPLLYKGVIHREYSSRYPGSSYANEITQINFNSFLDVKLYYKTFKISSI